MNTTKINFYTQTTLNGHEWKTKNFIEENPIGIFPKASSLLITELDCHCSSLFVLFHQYQKHHWLVQGPQFRDLHLFLEENFKQVHGQVDEIAERITVLGGIPTSSPTEISKNAYIEHEKEGAYRLSDMLMLDLLSERKIALKICKTIQMANEFGDYGTKYLLEKVLYATETRAHHLDHFLGEDSLDPAKKAKQFNNLK